MAERLFSMAERPTRLDARVAYLLPFRQIRRIVCESSLRCNSTLKPLLRRIDPLTSCTLVLSFMGRAQTFQRAHSALFKQHVRLRL
jgi:hypothetical protein